MRTIKYLSKEVYVMKKVVTANQIKEIEKLIPEHGDALMAYGADMYREGIFSGFKYALIGIAVGGVTTLIFDLANHCKEKKNAKENN